LDNREIYASKAAKLKVNNVIMIEPGVRTIMIGLALQGKARA
jgi:hypothetical protein